MLSADKLAIRRVLGAIETLLLREEDPHIAACATCAAQRYALGVNPETDRRTVLRARMHLESASEQLERAGEYVAILEDRLAL